MENNMGIKSYISPKAGFKKSRIHGLGLFAVKPIRKGEIVAIKGGHIFHENEIRRMEAESDESYIQIEDEFYIGAMNKQEVKGNKLFLNHSCDPNLGIRGQITFVAMRNIKAGQELTYDWAVENAWKGVWKLKCNCGAKNCRRYLRGRDWQLGHLQKKYKGFFSAYIQEKIYKSSKKRVV